MIFEVIKTSIINLQYRQKMEKIQLTNFDKIEIKNNIKLTASIFYKNMLNKHIYSIQILIEEIKKNNLKNSSRNSEEKKKVPRKKI